MRTGIGIWPAESQLRQVRSEQPHRLAASDALSRRAGCSCIGTPLFGGFLGGVGRKTIDSRSIAAQDGYSYFTLKGLPFTLLLRGRPFLISCDGDTSLVPFDELQHTVGLSIVGHLVA